MFLLALALFILSSILCGASNQIVELWVSLRNSHLRFLYAESTQTASYSAPCRAWELLAYTL
jgi:hypothetical protein